MKPPPPLPSSFPEIVFAGQLRTSQAEVVQLAQRQLNAGQKRLHVVAPPGSGKTILGLYLWAHLVRTPAIVLSPNSAIQAQWAARTDLFRVGRIRRPLESDWISTQAQHPRLLTSLTYQSVTLPDRGNQDWDQQAIGLWMQKLVDKQQAQDLLEAEVWLQDLQQQNAPYYEDRLAIYRKEVREGMAADGRNLELLHRSAISALQAARQAGVKLLILDECHHLVGHWGRVLQEAVQMLDDPVVIGLTATPPDVANKSAQDVRLYQQLLGEVQYEVPVPAVVKDGFLAPYQDLVQFVRPTARELEFVSNVDRQFRQVLRQACQWSGSERARSTATSLRTDVGEVPESAEDRKGSDEPEAMNSSTGVNATSPRELVRWVHWSLQNRHLPQGIQPSWKEFARRDPTFSDVGRQLLLTLGIPLPIGVPTLTLPEDLVSVRQKNLQLRRQAGSDQVSSSTDPVSWPDDTQLAGLLHGLPLGLVTPVLDRYVRHRLRRSEDGEDRKMAESMIGQLRMLGIQITETGYQACASPVSRVLAYSQNKCRAMVEILRREQQLLGDQIRAVVVTDYERTSAVQAEISDLMDEHAGGAMAAFRELLECPETNRLDPILLTGSTVLVDQDLCPSLLQHGQSWLEQRQLQVQLEVTQAGHFAHLSGKGKDWCPRVYVEWLTELFQEGGSRCLVGTRGLLGEGWDASRTNVLVDLTTVTTSMSVNQLRGRSIRLDSQWPEKVANNWDVVCIAPEFARGFDDFDRFRNKHESLFGVTDDGQIEKGAGHVHAIFNELQPEDLELSWEPLNQEMLQRAGRRSDGRQCWKIGQPYQGQLTHSVELKSRHPAGRPTYRAVGWKSQQWNHRSLTETLGQVILTALLQLGKIQSGALQVGQREDNTVRLFLQKAAPHDAALFAAAISQVMGPLDDARYIIPRQVTVRQSNWLSRWFPDFIGRWMEKHRSQLAMWHAVPDALAGNKSEVQIFQTLWNQQVSPGQALFAHRGEGRKTLQQAMDTGATPDLVIHQTEIFQ